MTAAIAQHLRSHSWTTIAQIARALSLPRRNVEEAIHQLRLDGAPLVSRDGSMSRRPRLLDLFSGAGGAAMGYARAGFEVVGVDLHPQPRYPFEFHQADALEFLSETLASGFDVVHASPPCQRYSSITKVRGRAEGHPDLIGPTRAALEALDRPWVMENVERARSWMREPVVICSTSLGLGIIEDGKRYVLRRHRLFETNWWLMVPPCACQRYGGPEVLGVYGGGPRQDTRLRKNLAGGNTNRANRRQAAALMQMPWATRQEMNQAIPPAYTEWVGRQLLAVLEQAA